MKTLLRGMAVGLSALAMSSAVATNSAASAQGTSQAPAQGTAQVSAADAEPFLGDWTLALQGPNGPGTFQVSLTAEKEKVSADIASDELAKQPISTVSLAGKSLLLAYTFMYNGSPVDATVSMTPGQDGKMAAQIDFAGGAYLMTGTATKKEKPKDK